MTAVFIVAGIVVGAAFHHRHFRKWERTLTQLPAARPPSRTATCATGSGERQHEQP